MISFCDKVTCSVDERKRADIIFLEFCKDFVTITHSILLDKLSVCETNRLTVVWVNWLNTRESGYIWMVDGH